MNKIILGTLMVLLFGCNKQEQYPKFIPPNLLVLNDGRMVRIDTVKTLVGYDTVWWCDSVAAHSPDELQEWKPK